MSRRSLSIYQRKYPFLAGVERLLHRSMTGLIGNSEAVAAELKAECGEPGKVAIIHNGIELPPPMSRDQRMACRRRLGLSDDEFVMVIVANLIAYKGHSDLLEALSRVREKIGPKWRVLFAGRDQGIGDTLRRQAEAAGLANHVVWLGEVADPNSVLPAADLGVLPSHEEGFSNSLLEKMAQGLPVIATEVGGNIDAVANNENGLLVPVRSPAELGDAIAALHGDADLRQRLGSAARLRVERSFSIEACTRRYLDLYSGLMRGDRPVAELTERSHASSSAIAAS
jgi:glycosyltransferase involved in cell wall biosynthesis